MLGFEAFDLLQRFFHRSDLCRVFLFAVVGLIVGHRDHLLQRAHFEHLLPINFLEFGLDVVVVHLCVAFIANALLARVLLRELPPAFRAVLAN